MRPVAWTEIDYENKFEFSIKMFFASRAWPFFSIWFSLFFTDTFLVLNRVFVLTIFNRVAYKLIRNEIEKKNR